MVYSGVVPRKITADYTRSSVWKQSRSPLLARTLIFPLSTPRLAEVVTFRNFIHYYDPCPSTLCFTRCLQEAVPWCLLFSLSIAYMIVLLDFVFPCCLHTLDLYLRSFLAEVIYLPASPMYKISLTSSFLVSLLRRVCTIWVIKCWLVKVCLLVTSVSFKSH